MLIRYPDILRLTRTRHFERGQLAERLLTKRRWNKLECCCLWRQNLRHDLCLTLWLGCESHVITNWTEVRRRAFETKTKAANAFTIFGSFVSRAQSLGVLHWSMVVYIAWKLAVRRKILQYHAEIHWIELLLRSLSTNCRKVNILQTQKTILQFFISNMENGGHHIQQNTGPNSKLFKLVPVSRRRAERWWLCRIRLIQTSWYVDFI